ncbi:ABC transporter permease [Aegicerativicinus sediminis]
MLIYLRLFKESFAFALNALRNNKLRTFLSLLGITVGIFSIIAVLAAVDSLKQNITDLLSGLDNRTIYVTSFSFRPTEVPRWQWQNFPQPKYDEFDNLSKNLPDVDAIAYAFSDTRETIKYQDKTLENIPIQAVSEGIYRVNDFIVERGRFFTEGEAVSGAPIIVLGYDSAENLFGSADPIGKQIRVYGRKLTVVGVLKKYGSSIFGNPDEKGLVPINFVRRFRSENSNFIRALIVIKPEKEADLEAFKELLRQKLRNMRGIKAGEIDTFFISELSGMTNAIDQIFGILNTVGWAISGFSLLVGGFGIANIMFVSVKERTNLIGIQKSLGAKNKFILFQFLFEAIILALVGGVVGLILVWIITLIASTFTGTFEFVLSFGNMILGFTLSTIIGLAAGILPALSASRLDPVEAIRTGM